MFPPADADGEEPDPLAEDVDVPVLVVVPVCVALVVAPVADAALVETLLLRLEAKELASLRRLEARASALEATAPALVGTPVGTALAALEARDEAVEASPAASVATPETAAPTSELAPFSIWSTGVVSCARALEASRQGRSRRVDREICIVAAL